MTKSGLKSAALALLLCGSLLPQANPGLVGEALIEEQTLLAFAGVKLPQYPLVQVNTAMPAPSGPALTTTNVCGKIQAAIDSDAAAPHGGIIRIPAGPLSGNCVIHLRNKASTDWTIIESASAAALPAAGLRVGPSDKSNMPQWTSGSSGAGIDTDPGAHNYRLIGLNIYNQSSNFTLVEIGNNANGAGAFASHIILDRMLIQGPDIKTGNNQQHCVGVTGYALAVISSYISDCYIDTNAGPDSQGIYTGNTNKSQQAGPLLFMNNSVDAGTENQMFGGGIVNGTVAGEPHDVLIAYNDFHKNPARRYAVSSTGAYYLVKDILEMKECIRCYAYGNKLSYSWRSPGGQDGEAIQLQDVDTWYNPGPDLSNSLLTDIIFAYNVVQHAASLLDSAGANYANPQINIASPSQPWYINPLMFRARNFYIHDTLATDISQNKWCPANDPVHPAFNCQNSIGHGLGASAMTNFIYDHNTVVNDPSDTGDNSFALLGPGKIFGSCGALPRVFVALTGAYVVTNNIGNAGLSGIATQACLNGFQSIYTYYASNSIASANIMVGATAAQQNNNLPGYPQFYPPTWDQCSPRSNCVGFTNYNNGFGGDYSLAPNSNWIRKSTTGGAVGANATMAISVTACLAATPANCGTLPSPLTNVPAI